MRRFNINILTQSTITRGIPLARRIYTRRLRTTLLNALDISRASSKATLFFSLQIIQTQLTSRSREVIVERFRLIPIYQAESRLCYSARRRIQAAVIALIRLPVVLRRAIGLQALGKLQSGFPSFYRATMRAILYLTRQQPIVQQAFITFIIAQINGSPSALRKPFSIVLVLGVLKDGLLRIATRTSFSIAFGSGSTSRRYLNLLISLISTSGSIGKN